jgi:putative N6-adenine-specific DNA methylase
MAQKHRFKKEREFKLRLEETEQNEEADIRSFTFHHHDLERNDRPIRKKREDRDDRRDGKKGKGGRFDRGDRKFNKAERNFTKKRKFDDDED